MLLTLTLLCLLALGNVIGQRYRIGLDFTHCLPYRVYLLDLSDIIPRHRQGFYVFRAQGLEPVFAESTWIVKRLVGLPGDIVAVTSGELIRVNRDNLRQGLPVAKQLGQTQNLLSAGMCWNRGITGCWEIVPTALIQDIGER